METVVVPKSAKWPFLFADACLIAFSAGVLLSSPQPPGIWVVVAAGTAALAGGLFGVWPYIQEYKTAAKLTETEAFQNAVDRIARLDEVANQITGATSQWQTVQETSQKTVQTAQAIAERITSEARAFSEFLQKTNDADKSHMRLEIEKHQRAQNEWLHITVAMLDHTNALYQAALRSGQPNLVAQLGHFQDACRDVARRVGLAPFIPAAEDFFDERLHQLLDAGQTPPPESRIGSIIAPGYTLQGQLIRRAVIALQQPEQPGETLSPAPAAEPEPAPSASIPAASASNTESSGSLQVDADGPSEDIIPSNEEKSEASPSPANPVPPREMELF